MASYQDISISAKVQDSEICSESSCKICLKTEAKYTCPRCNIAYCSVSCYQDAKHTGCSEAFYKDCVLEELQEKTSSDEDKRKVLEMLSRDLDDRTSEDPVENEDDEPSLVDRLQDLDLDKDIGAVWSQLSTKEKEEFARMYQDGRLAKLIDVWTPWWRHEKNMTLVKEDMQTHEKRRDLSAVPPNLSDIPDINNLLKTVRPSSDCRFDLVNILYAFAFVARIHNGDMQDCPIDSSQLILASSVVLNGQGRSGSVGEAIEQSINAVKNQHTEKSEWSVQFGLSLLEDVIILVSGPGKSCHSLGFMAAALSEVARLFRHCHRLIKKEMKSDLDNTNAESLHKLKSDVFKAEKKCVFFLSWLTRYGMGMHQLLPLLHLELERRQADVEDLEDLKSQVEKNLDDLRPKSEVKQQKQCKIVEIT